MDFHINWFFIRFAKNFDLTFELLLDSIKKRKFYPVYLFHGEEGFLIDALVEEIENTVLNPSEREFNQNIFYGKDTDVRNIISSCLQYPMMSEHRLVIVKEAQTLKDIDLLISTVDDPVQSTILVIAYKEGRVNMTTKLGRALKSNAEIFEAKRFYESEIPRWILNYSKGLNMKITENAAIMLTTLLSNDLSKINNELQKLKILYSENQTIDVLQIKGNIGLNREFNVYELGNALGEKDNSKVFLILNLFTQNPTAYPNVVIISALFTHFFRMIACKENSGLGDNELAKLIGVNSFFIKDYRKYIKYYSSQKLREIISILHEYDMRSKGVENLNIDQLQLIKEMLLKILN